MPNALIINPNTSVLMSTDIDQAAQKVFHFPWDYHVVNAPAGPESLESWRDYHLASVMILPLLHEYTNVDGIVLACFGDPGLYMLKEISPVPVVGIAEAAMSLALLLGGRFGIIAGMRRAVQLMDSMVRTYGLEARYVGTLSVDMRVLNFEENREATLSRLDGIGRQLVDRGADVVLLGCTGLTGFLDEIKNRIPAVIIDPVEAGCRFIKMIIEAGLTVSHNGIYSKPAPQKMNRLERLFGKDMVDIFKNWEEE